MGRGRSDKSRELVQLTQEILAKIQPASVRAVCYQLFTRGAIPSMEKTQTNRVGVLLTRAREEGDIPWEWIVQEGRAIESLPSWDAPADYARAVQASYRLNKLIADHKILSKATHVSSLPAWQGQPTRLIVVSEKGTVRGTLEPVLRDFEVDFLPVGGYTSATRVKDLAEQADREQPLIILYLGDHDPSGRGMSDADLPRRLLRYAMDDPGGNRELKAELRDTDDADVASQLDEYGLAVRRLALVEVDCTALGRTLSFPAKDKKKDPRYPWFVRRFGTRCWELDAMNPNDLRARVTEAIEAELDHEEWNRYVAAEQAERASITKTLKTWNSISGLA